MILGGIAVVLLIAIAGTVGVLALDSNRRAWSLSTAEFVLLCSIVGTGIIGWLGLVLAEVGVFSPYLLGALIALGAVGAVVLRRDIFTAASSPRRLRKVRLSWRLTVAVAAVVFVCVLYFRPFEWVMGGLDPGVYVNTGANIAKTGRILIQDAEVSGLPEVDRGALFAEPPKAWVVGSRHVGFYLRDFTGTIEPHGLHMYPVWIAILYSLGGFPLSLFAAPAFAVLGQLALYCLGTRLGGRMVGGLAAGLLALNTVNLWFGRYPAAEMLGQFLLLGGAWTALLAFRESSRRLAAVAGATLGLVLLAKAEVVAVPIVIFAWLLLAIVRGQFGATHRAFAAAYAAVAIHAYLHASFFATTYTLGVLTNLGAGWIIDSAASPSIAGLPHALKLSAALFSGPALVILSLGAIVAVGLALILRYALIAPARLVARLAGWRRFARPGLAGIVLVAGVFAAFVRPLLAGLPRWPAPFGIIQSGDPATIEKLGWIISPVGVACLVLGLAMFIIRERGGALIIAVVLAQLLITLYQGFIVPSYFWAARRDVPLVIPAAALFGAYFVIWAVPVANRFRLARLATGLLITAALLWPQVLADATWGRFKEFDGAIAQVDSFARTFPSGSVLVFDNSPTTSRLAAPLQYEHDLTVFTLPDCPTDSATFADMFGRWQESGRPTFFISTTYPPCDLKIIGQSRELIGTSSIVLPAADLTRVRLPVTSSESALLATVYQVSSGTNAIPEWRSIDLVNVESTGLVGWETLPENVRAVWTGESSTIAIPTPAGTTAIRLRQAGGRGKGVRLARQTVLVNGEIAGAMALENGFRDYLFSVPLAARNAPKLTIELRGTTITRVNADTAGATQQVGALIQSIAID